MKMEEIFLSDTTLRALREEFPGGWTPSGLAAHTEDELLAVPGLGFFTVEQIKRYLAHLGLKLKEGV